MQRRIIDWRRLALPMGLAVVGVAPGCHVSTRIDTEPVDAATETGTGGADETTGDVDLPSSDPRCSVVNQGLIDECPAGEFCRSIGHDDEGSSVFVCEALCSGPEDCLDDLDCYDADERGLPYCAEPLPECDVLAEAADCACDFDAGEDTPILRVSALEGDCEILEEDRTACYLQWATCLDGCSPELLHYDLGDGTSLVMLGLQGGISDGWERTFNPCDAVAEVYEDHW
jgi:hypothetical protein